MAAKPTTDRERIGRRKRLFLCRLKSKGKGHDGKYRMVSGRYRITFRSDHATATVDVLAILLRTEKTYR